MDKDNQTIILRDGRKVGFAETGSPDGYPVLFMGGASGRALRPPDDDTAQEYRLRLLILERPGFGLSTHAPNRTLLSWADDVAQFADALHLDRFAVVGVSQGGPYAMAAAYRLPERVSSLTLVSAVAPLDAPGVTRGMNPAIGVMTALAKYAPFVLTSMYNLMGGMMRRDPERFIAQAFANMPPSDRPVLNDPRVRAMFRASMEQGIAQGGAPNTLDMRLVASVWGFGPRDIRLPRVYLWQGEADPNVTPAMGRYLASEIPGCQATFVPDAGHFLAYTHWRAIAAQLATE